MEVLVDNLPWMSLNIFLAFLGVFFGYIYLLTKPKYLKPIFFILWVLFLPNTIYLITDIQYLPKDLTTPGVFIKFALTIQYLILLTLGLITHYLALKPLEQILNARFKKDKTTKNTIIILSNFVVAFAVVLGKIQRTHSWYVFTDPLRVVRDVTNTLNTPKLIIFIILFGMLFNIIYFKSKQLSLKKVK